MRMTRESGLAKKSDEIAKMEDVRAEVVTLKVIP